MRLGIDPTNDYVFRLAFGDPANSDLLIHLLNAILELPSPITSVEILNPFIEKEYDDDKLAILDIKARDSDGRLLNVEMQTSVTPALRERLLYYAACLFTSQLTEGDPYEALRPTIGICILSTTMFPQVPGGHLKFVLSDLRHAIELTPNFQIHTVELPKYNLSGAAPPTSGSLERWAWLLRRAEGMEARELRFLLPEPPFQKLIGILEMISKTPDQRHIYDSLQRAARDRAWKIEAARREGLQSGLDEGREKGIAEGREKGREEGREEGREVGEQLGIAKGQRIGQIRLMEQFLSEQQSDEHQLAGLTIAELDERVAKLQIRMHSQGNAQVIRNGTV